MRKRFLVILAFVFLIVNKIEGNNFRCESIVYNLPSMMEVIEQRKRRIINNKSVAEYVILLYYGSDLCTSCSIKQIVPLEGLYKAVKYCNNIEMVVLFDVTPENYLSVETMLLEADLQFPVCIDVEGTFVANNPFIKQNKQFRQSLISKDGTPILFGNPLNSDEIWIKYIDFIRQYGVVH